MKHRSQVSTDIQVCERCGETCPRGDRDDRHSRPRGLVLQGRVLLLGEVPHAGGREVRCSHDGEDVTLMAARKRYEPTCTAKHHVVGCCQLTFAEAARRIGVTPRTIRGYFQARLFTGFPGFLVAATRGKVWMCQLDEWEAARARRTAHGVRS